MLEMLLINNYYLFRPCVFIDDNFEHDRAFEVHKIRWDE